MLHHLPFLQALFSEFTVSTFSVMSSLPVSALVCIVSCFAIFTSGFHHPPEGAERLWTTPHNAAATTRNPRIFTDLHYGGHRLAEAFVDKHSGGLLHCNMLGDRNLIGHFLNSARAQVIHATPHEMSHLLHLCLNLPLKRQGSALPRLSNDSLRNLSIFPGTKWCGAGDIAENEFDLGEARDSDICCREHDRSKNTIAPFEEKYGIRNHRFYTMSNCAEDRKLFNCFLNVGSFTSVSLGITFFDILKTRCFEYGYPTKCVRYETTSAKKQKKRCEEFKIDTSKRRKWRVFSPPNFFKAFRQGKWRKNNFVKLWLSDDTKE